MLDNVNGVVGELYRKYSRTTSAKADDLRQKRRKKEQKRKNKNKKLIVRGRQMKDACELLTGKKTDIDITTEATEAIINTGTINREALLRKRFHLEPLKDLVQQRYVCECVLPEVKEAVKNLEAPLMTAVSNTSKTAKGKQMTVSACLSF